MSAARNLTLMVCGMLLFLLVNSMSAVSPELLHVSIPKERLARDDRVIGFVASIVSGRVFSLPNVPIGWSIAIDNDPSWRTSVKGTIIVGAASLDTKQDPAFFEHFLVIEKEPGSDVPLDIKVELATTTDFAQQKKIFLKRSDLKVEPNRRQSGASMTK